MKAKTIIALGRMACGTAILITHMITGANSTYIVIALGLLGIPVEAIQRDKV